jgi:hypothetical protein
MILTASTILMLLTSVQIALFAIDELHCHRKRGLPRWEIIGHPIDTVSTLLTYSIAVFLEFSPTHLTWYTLSALASCIIVTKDEFVHAKLCDGFESWIHALMFMLHPVMFIAFGYAWSLGEASHIMQLIAGSALLVGVYQIVFWKFFYDHSHQ